MTARDMSDARGDGRSVPSVLHGARHQRRLRVRLMTNPLAAPILAAAALLGRLMERGRTRFARLTDTDTEER